MLAGAGALFSATRGGPDWAVLAAAVVTVAAEHGQQRVAGAALGPDEQDDHGDFDDDQGDDERHESDQIPAANHA